MKNSQKFTKLSFDAFSKEELTDNKLRSVNGGAIETCGDNGRDVLWSDGMTSIGDIRGPLVPDIVLGC